MLFISLTEWHAHVEFTCRTSAVELVCPIIPAGAAIVTRAGGTHVHLGCALAAVVTRRTLATETVVLHRTCAAIGTNRRRRTHWNKDMHYHNSFWSFKVNRLIEPFFGIANNNCYTQFLGNSLLVKYSIFNNIFPVNCTLTVNIRCLILYDVIKILLAENS